MNYIEQAKELNLIENGMVTKLDIALAISDVFDVDDFTINNAVQFIFDRYIDTYNIDIYDICDAINTYCEDNDITLLQLIDKYTSNNKVRNAVNKEIENWS